MKIFIEADSIVADNVSGIGHATLEIIRGFDQWIDAHPEPKNKLTIIVPFGKKPQVTKYHFRHVRVRSLPPGYKYVNYALTRTSLPVPVDVWFGRGVYLFPNYKTWFVPFSHACMFVQDLGFRTVPDTLHPKNLPYMQANFDRWLKRADAIITTSEQSAGEFTEYYPQYKHRQVTIPLGVDLQEFYPRTAAEIDKARSKYKIPPDYFLYISNIEPRKNIDRLLDAYQKYSDQAKKPAVLILIGGDGWKNEQTLQKIHDLQTAGYAVIRPHRYVQDADLPALYTGARALIAVPLHEGFGLSPLQAQACGTPVIVSDIPVFRETLLPAKAAYVPYDNVTAITHALTKAEAAAGKRKRPPITLTWDNTIEKIVSFIKTRRWS